MDKIVSAVAYQDGIYIFTERGKIYSLERSNLTGEVRIKLVESLEFR